MVLETMMAPIFVPADYFRVLEKSEIFPDADRPMEVDLGCGDGSFLEAMAAQHPERNFLGVERLLGRIEKTARRITQKKLTNARVLRLESSYVLGWLLPPASVTRLHLLCPDPWPKKKHHRRRLFQDREFLDGLVKVLVPGGEFLLKSDDDAYFEDAVEVMARQAPFSRLDWPAEAFFYPVTSFEKQWLAQGKGIHRARWRRMQGES
jgi:tRNA (guanine-N7-)-methyltransferase